MFKYTFSFKCLKTVRYIMQAIVHSTITGDLMRTFTTSSPLKVILFSKPFFPHYFMWFMNNVRLFNAFVFSFLKVNGAKTWPELVMNLVTRFYWLLGILGWRFWFDQLYSELFVSIYMFFVVGFVFDVLCLSHHLSQLCLLWASHFF